MSKTGNTFYVTVTHGLRGYFAVLIIVEPNGFYEPYQTGIGIYNTREDAEPEAREWARNEEIEYRP
jgi:hypothetical protein